MIEITIFAKDLDFAKRRLASALDDEKRRTLALAMLEDILAVLSQFTEQACLSVLSADPRIGACATRSGALWLPQDGGQGLNESARHAARRAQGLGRRLLLLPSDVPLVRAADIASLLAAGRRARVVGVRARDGGTNALFLEPDPEFRFSYGVESFDAHRREAWRLGLSFHSVLAPGLAFDLDTPIGLDRVRAATPGPRTASALSRHPERIG